MARAPTINVLDNDSNASGNDVAATNYVGNIIARATIEDTEDLDTEAVDDNLEGKYTEKMVSGEIGDTTEAEPEATDADADVPPRRE